MHQKIKAYYRGERISNALFSGYGLMISILAYSYFYLNNGLVSTGLLIGLVSIGMYQILVGAVRFLKTVPNYRNAEKGWIASKSLFVREEKIKVEKALERFAVLRKIESIAFVISFTIIVCCVLLGVRNTLLGTAIAINFQSAVVLVVDLMAQFRTQEYHRQLEKM